MSRSCITASSRIIASEGRAGHRGAAFTSDTDTEVIAHLVTRELKAGSDPVRATFHTLRRLEGALPITMMFRGFNDLMIVARQGSPLAVGYGKGEMFVGSDALALAPFTDRVCLPRGRRLSGALPAKASPSATAPAIRCSGRWPAHLQPRFWSIRATTATSWRRRSTSSPKSSAIHFPAPSISSWAASRRPNFPFDFAN